MALLATFDQAKALFLLTVVGIQRKLSKRLGCPVDLGNATAIKPRLKPHIEPDLISAFYSRSN